MPSCTFPIICRPVQVQIGNHPDGSEKGDLVQVEAGWNVSHVNGPITPQIRSKTFKSKLLRSSMYCSVDGIVKQGKVFESLIMKEILPGTLDHSEGVIGSYQPNDALLNLF